MIIDQITKIKIKLKNGENENEPILCVVAVEIVLPVAHPVLLVKTGVVCADIGDSSAILVAHVEDLTMVLGVSVKSNGSVAAVEAKGYVGKVLPPLGSVQDLVGIFLGCRLGHDVGEGEAGGDEEDSADHVGAWNAWSA